MRIIIEIEGGEFVAAPLAGQKAQAGVLMATAVIGAEDAGSAPTGMMRVTMETEERAEENVLEPATLAKEKASDAGSAAEAIDAGKPPRSLMEEV